MRSRALRWKNAKSSRGRYERIASSDSQHATRLRSCAIAANAEGVASRRNARGPGSLSHSCRLEVPPESTPLRGHGSRARLGDSPDDDENACPNESKSAGTVCRVRSGCIFLGHGVPVARLPARLHKPNQNNNLRTAHLATSRVAWGSAPELSRPDASREGGGQPATRSAADERRNRLPLKFTRCAA